MDDGKILALIFANLIPVQNFFLFLGFMLFYTLIVDILVCSNLVIAGSTIFLQRA